ncbi:MAG: hypothetical protein ACLPWS_05915, partial [Rhodomicrobium sp.]
RPLCYVVPSAGSLGPFDAFERVKKSSQSPTVMAGLDPAIQQHSECIGFFMVGPVKPGHDN